jgi:hypothetical protein
MNKIEQLIKELPGLCGAKQSWARSGVFQYHDEIAHPEFYPRVTGESFFDRCISSTSLVDDAKDYYKAAYGINLLELADASAHGDVSRRDEIKSELSPKEHLYPDISKIMTVDEASKVLAWSPEVASR